MCEGLGSNTEEGAVVKIVVIAVLVPLVAIGGAISAFAADRTIETNASVEVRVWQNLLDRSLYLSTRPEGGRWTTHDAPMELRGASTSGYYALSSAATISVPVVVEVEEPELEPPETTEVPASVGGPPSGPASCCTVRGMSDSPATRRAVVAAMRGVIAFAREHFGFTHRGPITINISHTTGGLLVRHEEAFGEGLRELPSECSFQQGEHMFFGPACRLDERAIATEWIIRAADAHHVSPRWASVATVEYYLAHYLEESPPTLRDDRFRRVLFYEEATDFRGGQASDEMTTTAVLYAIRAYGSIEDWLEFYQDVRDGSEENAAFEAAFGVSLPRFYVDFEGWAARQKAILHTTAYGSCLEASRHLSPRRLLDGGGFADYTVPLEWDDDGDGYVCEDYSAFPTETLACVVVGEGPADDDGSGGVQ